MAEKEAIPTIDTALEEPEPIHEPGEVEPKQVTAATKLTDLEVEGVTPRQFKALVAKEIVTVGDLYEKKDAIEETPGIGGATKKRILDAVETALVNQ